MGRLGLAGSRPMTGLEIAIGLGFNASNDRGDQTVHRSALSASAWLLATAASAQDATVEPYAGFARPQQLRTGDRRSAAGHCRPSARSRLSAQLTPEGSQITRGLVWRVFGPQPGPDGKRLSIFAWLFRSVNCFRMPSTSPLDAGLRAVRSSNFPPTCSFEVRSRTYDGLWLRGPEQFLHDALPRARAVSRCLSRSVC